MNSYQVNIIWLGLILVTLNIIVNYGEFRSVVTGNTSTSSSSSNAQQTPARNLV